MHNESPTPQALAHRTALITGGTAGLGLACARTLLQSAGAPWHVVIAARNPEQGAQSAALLNREAGGRGSVRYMPLDLGSLADVRRFATELVRQGVALDALVLNAGLQFVGAMQRTHDGFEATLGINHLGHFLLFHALSPLLTAHARVVVVSSGTHDPLQRSGMPEPRFLHPDLLAHPERDEQAVFAGKDSALVTGQRRYTTSKLCNLYFAYELDRRLRALPEGHRLADVAVSAFDPGFMPGTGLARDYPPALRFISDKVMPLLRPLLRLMMRSQNIHAPAVSGRALAALVESNTLTPRTGGYFEGNRSIRSSQESYDAVRAEQLWQDSISLVALAASESAFG